MKWLGQKRFEIWAFCSWRRSFLFLRVRRRKSLASQILFGWVMMKRSMSEFLSAFPAETEPEMRMAFVKGEVWKRGREAWMSCHLVFVWA